MNASLEKYLLVRKFAVGPDLKLFFESKYDMDERRVLELIDVAGYVDTTTIDTVIHHVDIKELGSTYTFDLAARLDRPEVGRFKEVFLYTDAQGLGFSFRAVAREVNFRYEGPGD
ncbi:hypothetical protein MKQ68_21410 [Chitinophaga horti]|uniref:Uncharacterized protein n=1 Tax=Chitinophaga horti TaxID=2920382 RepID=A0ABY6IZN4_9BACT|nr:hypothetical protein [Chitinophaga horti]UYQ92641.1 hypothetical protein MKQ68_21410 [Chitinophaga horti]